MILRLVALQDGGYRHPWKSAAVIAPLLMGIVIFALFVIWEGWYAPHPMIPRVLYHEKGVVIPLTVAFGAGMHPSRPPCSTTNQEQSRCNLLRIARL